MIGFSICVLANTPAFARQTHLLVVTGVPDDEEHAKQFEKWFVAGVTFFR